MVAAALVIYMMSSLMYGERMFMYMDMYMVLYNIPGHAVFFGTW